MDRDLLKKLEKAIEANLSDPNFGAEELAQISGMSRSNLLKKVRSISGKSINQLIREYRLNKALELLQNEDLPVSEIAARTGFNSPAYFATSFRKHFGYSPGDVLAHQSENPPVETQYIASLHRNKSITRKNTQPRILIISFSAIILITAAIVIFLFASGRIVKDKSIAVLPLRTNSQSAENTELTGLIWEQIITTLGQIEVFDVRSAVSSGQYRDTVGLSIPKIGRKLKVKYIIEGSLSRDDEGVRLWLQMINSKKDKHFGARDYTFPISELRNNMVELAEHTAFELKTILKPGEKSAILLRCTSSNESIENYRVGNSFMDFNKGIDPERALPFYRKAIELDSTWTSPYVQLATALGILERSDPKEEYARERLKAVEKAHELRPGPWTYRALVIYYLDNWDIKKASELYK
jgi:AraC-like DNA-binding protein/TolB-like protein